MNKTRKRLIKYAPGLVLILPCIPAFAQWLGGWPGSMLHLNPRYSIGLWVSLSLMAIVLAFKRDRGIRWLDAAFSILTACYGLVVVNALLVDLSAVKTVFARQTPWAAATVLSLAVCVGSLRPYRLFRATCVLLLIFVPFLHLVHIEIAPDSMRSHWHGLQYHSVAGKEVPIIETDGVHTYGVGLFGVPEPLTESLSLLPEDIAFRITFPNLPIYILFALLGLYALWLRPRWYSKE